MNPLRAWNQFWFAPISARPLGAFRIVFGLIALANLAYLSVEMDYWYTDAGLFQGTEARAGNRRASARHSPLHWFQSPPSFTPFFAVLAVAAVLFTIGWRTRVTGVLLYLGTLSLVHRNLVANAGPDSLLLIMTFYMMLCPCGAAYSLDARREARRRGTLAEPLIVPWTQRLIQIQISVVYFITAMWKCNGASWLNGTALHFVLNNTEVGRFRLDPLTQYPLAISVLTHVGLLTEFALAFLLWFRAVRPWVIFAGLGLHVGILLMVNVPIFGELMTACYLTFLTPDELDALLRRVDPRNWFARRARPTALTLRGPHHVEPVPLEEMACSS